MKGVGSELSIGSFPEKASFIGVEVKVNPAVRHNDARVPRERRAGGEMALMG
jgi:hypothetical protein